MPTIPWKAPGAFGAVLAVLTVLPMAPAVGAQETMPDDGATLFAGAETLDRQALVDAVLERNTSLEAARLAYRALELRVPQVTSLDDPMLSYGFGPLSPFDSDVRYGQVIEVSQRIPYPGKLGTRGDVARAEAESARSQAQAVGLDLALAASRLYDDYWLVDRRMAINQEHVRLLEDFLGTATARYSAGLVSQHVPLTAEVELAHLKHRDVTLGTEREVVVARLNALLHRLPRAPLPPASPALPASTHDPLAGLSASSIEAAQELALAVRPEIAAERAAIEARRAAVRLADLARYPDVTVGTSYNSMWNDFSHQWMVGASVNLPIRKKRLNAQEAEAEARLGEAENRLAHMEDVIRADVRQVYDRVLEAHHVAELYESRILPAAHDHVEASRVGFESNRASFLDLIEAEKNLRSSELAYHEVLADWSRRRAELARTLGLPPAPVPVREPDSNLEPAIPAAPAKEGAS